MLLIKKLNREILQLNDIINQLDLLDIYNTFCQNTKEYTFFSAAHIRTQRKSQQIHENSNAILQLCMTTME